MRERENRYYSGAVTGWECGPHEFVRACVGLSKNLDSGESGNALMALFCEKGSALRCACVRCARTPDACGVHHSIPQTNNN